MKQSEQTESATAVALAVFDFIELIGDEMVYDVNRAIDLIQAFGARQAREASRPRRGKIVQLRLVRTFPPRERV
ncbi:hypothetical protein [Candidatus Binatus sp.]